MNDDLQHGSDWARRQMAISSLAMFCILGYMTLNNLQQQKRDEALQASQDSTRQVAAATQRVTARLDSVLQGQANIITTNKAGIDTILWMVRDKSKKDRDLQRVLASTLRRELRAVNAGVDSVQEALPRKKGR